jgi:hypothetical protein
MNWKSTALVSGPAVVATWLFSTPATAPTAAPTPARAVATEGSAAASSDIEQQAARLQAMLRADGDYTAPSRNPFRFSIPTPRPAAVIRPVETVPAVVPPAPPSIRLEGIALDGDDAAPERTAILGTASDVVLAKEGDAAGSYRVTKIEDDAVELEANDGAVLRLTLKP